MANENYQYKDSVFTDLFYSDVAAKDNLMLLYNALFHENLTDPDEIGLMRLDKSLFMQYYNDVCFSVRKKRIVLTEHQSTVN